MRRPRPTGQTGPRHPDDGRAAPHGVATATRAPLRRCLAAVGRLPDARAARLAAAALAGAVLSLTLPPFDLVPAVAAWSALLWLMAAGERRARRLVVERLALGAAFGLGYHLAGLWWVGAAFLVDAETFGALLPLGVVGLPLILAPFHALAVALAGLAPQRMAWRAPALAIAIGGTEWLRGVVLTGFPWNAAGVQLSSVPALAQAASVVGVSGLGVVAVLMGSLPALVCARGSRWMALPVMALGAALILGGMMRLGAAPPAGEGPPAVRVVQPSVPQRHKWDPDHRAAIWQRLLSLTEGQGKGAAPVVIWPETAIPFLYRTPSLEQAELAEALRGRTLVTGVVETAGAGRATNSVLVIGPDGLVRQRYDKNHLVPFGEYLPLAGLLRRLGLSELVQASGAFVPGTGRAPLDLPGLPPATPLICYEVIFPGERADGPAHWIVNVTNDAWFGDTPGPRQHLRHARLRAVESGLALVRVANNGISAVFDPYGRPLATLPLDARGTFETPLPPRAAAPYAVVGDWPLLALFTAALAAALARRRAGPSAGA